MKKLWKLLILIILFFPFAIFASVKVNYSDAMYGANNYITSFKNYKWYIDFKHNGKYLYSGYTFNTLDGFNTGGLINRSEYNISIHNDKTYLKTARAYWTLTASDSNFYSIDNGTFSVLNRYIGSSGVRPTEYVVSQTEVTGRGSYADPWVFVKPNFYVDIEYMDSEIIRRQGDEELKLDGVAQYGDEIVYRFKFKNNGSDNSKVNIREVEMINDINNKISLLPETSKIKLGDKTYSLSEAKSAINGLLSKNGYTFTLKPGETIELEFSVKIIGNAGDSVSNQIVYTMDGIEAEPSAKNTIAIEKAVHYTEIAEIGANVVISLGNSTSLSSDELNISKEAAISFAQAMIGENSNTNNRLCVVIMNSGSRCFDGTGATQLQAATDYINGMTSTGNTTYNTALSASLTHLNSMKTSNPLNRNYLVFLSDGYPNSTTNYQTYESDIKDIAEIYTIGFINHIDVLEKLCTQSTDKLFSGGPYYYNASAANLSEVFEGIAKKINERSKITTRGVLAVLRNLDKSKNLIIQVSDKNDNIKYTKTISYQDALDQSYIINKGNRYEINIKLFDAEDKITVTYYLEKN